MESKQEQHSLDAESEDTTEFVSLEELGNVYAKVLQGATPSTPLATPSAKPPTTGDFHGSIVVQGETDGIPVSVASIIEAILFVGSRGGQPVSIEQLKLSMKEFSEAEILQGIEQLQEDLRSNNSSVRIILDQEGYRLSLTEDLEGQIEELKWGVPKEVALSQTAIDCLSLVAYQPGVSREDLEKHLGQAFGSTISLLLRRGLITLESDGYHTTERFLEIVGIQSLEELPKPNE
jgi:segregation and condensation protein B